MLIAVVFGTSVMVNAATLPNKTTTVKEVKATNHPKHKKAKAEKKTATPESSASKEKK